MAATADTATRAAAATPLPVTTETRITGLTYDGGYAEYMIAPGETLAAIPAGLEAIEAAPLMCAGITIFNALRNSAATGADLVAVLGLGGLGHLAVQFAAKMGFRTVAIARGKDKEPLARKLGASAYIDSQALDPAVGLAKLGGAKAVLATVTDSPRWLPLLAVSLPTAR